MISKHDHQMSKCWKRIAADKLETTNRFGRLKIGVPDCSGQGFNKNFLDSKHVLLQAQLKKNPDFGFLPPLLPKPVSVKNGHLGRISWKTF